MGFQIGGAAYLRVQLIPGLLRFIIPQGRFPGKTNKFLLYKDIRDFWFVKPDPDMRTFSFYKEILKVFCNIDVIHKWLPIYYSFFLVQISLPSLIVMG